MSDRSTFPSEREWSLDGLKRNRFRRAETARFLGSCAYRARPYTKAVQCLLLLTNRDVFRLQS